MRLYPPAWMIGRAARKDDVIGPFLIPAGTFVLVSPYVTHRHPRLWGNPEAFDPMRFVDGEASRFRNSRTCRSAGVSASASGRISR